LLPLEADAMARRCAQPRLKPRRRLRRDGGGGGVSAGGSDGGREGREGGENDCCPSAPASPAPLVIPVACSGVGATALAARKADDAYPARSTSYVRSVATAYGTSRHT
jgi:hypothetical protein